MVLAPGTLHLSAYHQGGNIVIQIKDDGGGLRKDRILKKAAAAMRRKLRHGEKIGRLGGDEFGLLLRNMTPEIIATKIAQISESLRQEDPTLAAYFGVEFYVPGMSVDDLYRAAAVRLSEAKRAKKAGQRVV
jgi:diguanylate cyclase (GGDEF)-like protein